MPKHIKSGPFIQHSITHTMPRHSEYLINRKFDDTFKLKKNIAQPLPTHGSISDEKQEMAYTYSDHVRMSTNSIYTIQWIFLRDKPYNIEKQVQFVMSTNEDVLMSSDQCSSPLCHPTRLLIYDHNYSDPVYRRTSLCTVYYKSPNVQKSHC